MESISVWNNNMLRYEIEKSAYIAVTNNRVVWGREPRDSNQSDLIPYFFFTCCQCKITTTLVDKPEGGGEKRGEEHQDHPVVIINRNSKSSMWVIKAEFPSTTLQYHKLLGSYATNCWVPIPFAAPTSEGGDLKKIIWVGRLRNINIVSSLSVQW